MLVQTFYIMAAGTFEMKMVVMVMVIIAGVAHSKIAFTILCHYFMGNAILTEAVEYSVDSHPVSR